jgi:hypothetical protein
MCISAAPARFAATTLYAGEVVADGRVVHVLGYENTVQNLLRPPGLRFPGRAIPIWRRRDAERAAAFGHARGNAMLLHFPAVPGTMSQANVVDTEDCPDILRDMVTALDPPRPFAWGAPEAAGPQDVEIFESGIYTVVLAADARAIPAALGLVPEPKRPPLNDKLFDWYAAAFPGWPVALCCFETARAVHATPMLWWYEPLDPDILFAPALDCHTGDVPDLTSHVKVDHWVVFGSSEMEGGTEVVYSDVLPPHVAQYLPSHVVGRQYEERMPNGDFLANVADVRQAWIDPRREVLAA